VQVDSDKTRPLILDKLYYIIYLNAGGLEGWQGWEMRKSGHLTAEHVLGTLESTYKQVSRYIVYTLLRDWGLAGRDRRGGVSICLYRVLAQT
jgi:hypothetical protein